MGNKRRIKILDTKYNQKQHVIYWKVRYLDDNHEITWVYRVNDIANALLGRDDISLTPEQAIKFNENWKGKEKWVTEEFTRNQLPKISDMTEHEIDAMSSEMNDYPIFELLGGKSD